MFTLPLPAENPVVYQCIIFKLSIYNIIYIYKHVYINCSSISTLYDNSELTNKSGQPHQGDTREKSGRYTSEAFSNLQIWCQKSCHTLLKSAALSAQEKQSRGTLESLGAPKLTLALSTKLLSNPAKTASLMEAAQCAWNHLLCHLIHPRYVKEIGKCFLYVLRSQQGIKLL